MAISAEERKRRNRASAQRSRDKQKKYSAELEQSVEQNRRENVELKTIIERYERDIVAILSQFEHPSNDDATNQIVLTLRKGLEYIAESKALCKCTFSPQE